MRMNSMIVSAMTILSIIPSCFSKEAEYKPIIEVDLGDTRLIDYYGILNGEIALAPTYQEVVVGNKTFTFDEHRFYIKDIYRTDEGVFMLILGNYGHYVSRLCDDGSLELVCDLYDIEPVDNIEVNIKFPKIEVKAFYGDSKPRIKIVSGGLIFLGCNYRISE